MTNTTTGLAAERLEKLRKTAREKHVVRVDDLCKEFGVSAATVRRDLEELETRGELRRVHGGAVSVESRLEEPLFDDKTSIAAKEKHAIAAAAAKLIKPGDSIYLDGGSTVLELARLLRDFSTITIVTHSLRAAIELSSSGPRLILVGGELRRRSQTMVGSLTKHMLDHLHVDKAFMGTIGLSVEHGMTTTEPAEAYTKELVMRNAQQVLLLADSTKVGKVSFACAGSLDQVHHLISDRHLNDDFRKHIQKMKLKLTEV